MYINRYVNEEIRKRPEHIFRSYVLKKAAAVILLSSICSIMLVGCGGSDSYDSYQAETLEGGGNKAASKEDRPKPEYKEFDYSYTGKSSREDTEEWARPLAVALTRYSEDTAAPSMTLIDGETAVGSLFKKLQWNTNIEEDESYVFRDFPAKFDLRDYGFVTPVKNQSPWGSCWGFSVISAAETSILSKYGVTYDDFPIDLSEHQLTYFAYSHLPDTGFSQDGEGVYLRSIDPLNRGGFTVLASSIFAQGIGASLETTIPYRGRSGKHDVSENFYSEDDDWTVDEELRFNSDFELVDSRVIKSPAVVKDGEYEAYSEYATNCIKSELMTGQAVVIAFCADKYDPSSNDNSRHYMNKADNWWTHYTYNNTLSNHSVCIVGWDDTIPASAFLDHSDDPDGDGMPHQPEGDGAWIVKNSWGAETEDFPNRGYWGIENEYGENTGYFYLSYYDHSLDHPQTFDFEYFDKDSVRYVVDQWDYLQEVDSYPTMHTTDYLSTANVFTADADIEVHGIGCETRQEKVAVLYEIYIMNDDAVVPEDGELVYQNVDYFEFAGFHRLTVDEPISVAEGQRYSVVLTECRVYDNGEVWYESSMPRQYSWERLVIEAENRGESADDIPLYYKGVINPGESYIYIAEKNAWADYADFTSYLNSCWDNHYEFDNFVIKAYSTYAQ